MVPAATAARPAAWEFWIDVGGTFTDCLARRPDGQLLRRKVLSSGEVPGRAELVAARTLVDAQRHEDPPGLWQGGTLRLFDEAGQPLGRTSVVAFDGRAGQFVVADELLVPVGRQVRYVLSLGEPAPVLAVRLLLGLRRDEPLPPLRMRLGTTRGTNALLTRGGPRTALVTTRGFGDVLHIGYQDRPQLFALEIRKRRPLFDRVVELDERLDGSGNILIPLQDEQVRRELERLRGVGIEAVAICLLHAYRNGSHEQRVAALARQYGFPEISVSSQVAPLIKIVARGETTVVSAYLNPLLRSYLEQLQQALGPQAELRVLTSAGGLVGAARFQGHDSILSGPAGGVVGVSRLAQAAGFPRAIGFDMGGTSTDVSRFDGGYELQYEAEKAGVRVLAPMLAIETVAAGGGSICAFDGVKLVVGPGSAGADPGPACYGRHGPLTVTDLNVFLGKIPAERFPFPLDPAAIDRRLVALRDSVLAATGRRYELPELAEGLVAIANHSMAQAIRGISIAKGYDPRDYVLVAFGGAAAQHACAVAGLLNVPRILLHPDAGLLSALGIGLADIVRHRAVGIYGRYEESVGGLDRVFADLEQETLTELLAEGVAREHIEHHRSLELRFEGLDASLPIPCPADGDYARAYRDEHQRLYGFAPADRPLEIVTARVETAGRTASPLPPSHTIRPLRRVTGSAVRPVWFAGRAWHTPLFDRGTLRPGDAVPGPAIVVEPYSTIVVDPDWQAEVMSGGELLLTRRAAVESSALPPAVTSSQTTEPPGEPGGTRPDPVALEIFHHHFAAIAEQMGLTLRNTASSVNVKERLDFSCAVFNAAGDLVANAPHIPVHLGAMSETVKAVIRQNPELAPGDVIVTNDPYQGGSHLPDITVISPIFLGEPAELTFFTASRAHHAEIGGMVPGSMPPGSRRLGDEGVLIRNFRLVASGRTRWDELRALLLSGRFPTRNVEHNLADIAAQVAANRQGARDLLDLVDRVERDTVVQYMRFIQLAAEQKMRRAIQCLPQGIHRFVDYLDDGSPVAVTIRIEGDEATLDFDGTGPVLPGNLNANRAIVTAAVMYCFRCLLNEDIPLNQGVLAPIHIVVPSGLLHPPASATAESCPAVAGGNVETSQRVVDVILGALGAAAASQGTMNNVSFGDASFGYYETLCGGAGATPRADGAAAVHTHMTNTRLTDPEVFEQRFPARILEFSIRRGSGGAGRHRGGDGVVRRIEFLRALDVSIVSQRRGPHPPFGLRGGAPGALGRNCCVRADGRVEELGAIAQFRAAAGDVLIIETPGGGGWGPEAV